MLSPWKTNNWFVSSLNYKKEVVSKFNFPKKVKFHDATLRDGEQQAGFVFSKDDKIRIADKLAEVGIDRIEAGMPAVSQQDELAIKEIVKRKLGPEMPFYRNRGNYVLFLQPWPCTKIYMEKENAHFLLKTYRGRCKRHKAG